MTETRLGLDFLSAPGRLAALVVDPAGGATKEFAAHSRSEYKKYGNIIKATGARAD
jgi:hypothetical protein